MHDFREPVLFAVVASRGEESIAAKPESDGRERPQGASLFIAVM